MNGTLKIVHLMCACLFLGNVIVSGVWAAMAERTRNHAVVQFSNRMVLITDLLFTLTGALGVVITGHLMAVRYGGDTAHPWLTWSYALFGLSGLIWLLVLVPIQLKQRQMLRRTTQITAEYLQLSRTWYIAGGLATVLPLPILYLMVNKVA
ncbi:MAG: DUF2269 domain-containing protein [Rubrivivax sp.]|jgi:uncharacterized membrane protein|nr:DUF2269 domain-containing protein [Rubrivivax sp.]